MSDATDASPAPRYQLRPTSARWTHVAFRVKNIDETIAWYTEFTPLELLDKRQDDDGFGAWLGHSDTNEFPFVLVFVQFFDGHDPFGDAPIATLSPFAHIGIELPTKDDVDEVAARGQERGCLSMPTTWMPPPIGYICMLKDPDGNNVEFSFDQGVYEKAREVWG
ncbi:MAG: VOC family protein [Actinomycetota bacterium]